MNSSRPGVLTIEAAITLPLVIIALVSLLFIAKVYYIQDQIHSAMTKAVHDMSVDAYVMDKLGLVAMQQNLYIEGARSQENIKNAVSSVSQNSGLLLMDAANVVDYGDDMVDWFATFEGINSGDDFESLASEALTIIHEGPALIETMTTNGHAMMTSFQTLYQEASHSMGSIALMEAVEFGNGIVADGVGEAAFHRYISNEQLEAWGIRSELSYIDFSMSSYMLTEDTVSLVAAYNIDIPYGNAWLGETIPVLQKVTARVWTGSYDAGTSKHRPMVNSEEEVEPIYYISTGDADNHSYHFFSCLRKPLIESTYEEEINVKHRDICRYCAEHYAVTEGMTVYYVNETSKVHLYHQCYTVYAQGVIAVTEEEAVNTYHRTPCKKYHCVAQSKGQEE